MYDKTFEEFVAELNENEEKLKSRYKDYCEHCAGTPLSYDDWVHTDVFADHLLDDLPF